MRHSAAHEGLERIRAGVPIRVLRRAPNLNLNLNVQLDADLGSGKVIAAKGGLPNVVERDDDGEIEGEMGMGMTTDWNDLKQVQKVCNFFHS